MTVATCTYNAVKTDNNKARLRAIGLYLFCHVAVIKPHCLYTMLFVDGCFASFVFVFSVCTYGYVFIDCNFKGDQ